MRIDRSNLQIGQMQIVTAHARGGGSYLNIPVVSLPGEQTMSGQIVTYFGVQYVIPKVVDWPGTVIAVNIGGAVIPLLVSLYLVVKFRIYGPALLGVAVVAFASHLVAHPMRGVGIAEPVFVPILVTVFTALLISRKYAAPIRSEERRIGPECSTRW